MTGATPLEAGPTVSPYHQGLENFTPGKMYEFSLPEGRVETLPLPSVENSAKDDLGQMERRLLWQQLGETMRQQGGRIFDISGNLLPRLAGVDPEALKADRSYRALYLPGEEPPFLPVAIVEDGFIIDPYSNEPIEIENEGAQLDYDANRGIIRITYLPDPRSSYSRTFPVLVTDAMLADQELYPQVGEALQEFTHALSRAYYKTCLRHDPDHVPAETVMRTSGPPGALRGNLPALGVDLEGKGAPSRDTSATETYIALGHESRVSLEEAKAMGTVVAGLQYSDFWKSYPEHEYEAALMALHNQYNVGINLERFSDAWKKHQQSSEH